MVLNRDGGTKDDQMTLEEWKDKEAQFFAGMTKAYPMYKSYKNKLGVAHLVKLLSYRLSKCIMGTSNYTAEITKLRDEERQICKDLARRLSSEETLMQLLTKFQGRATRMCRGTFNTYSHLPSDVLNESLTSKIKDIMSSQVAKFLEKEADEAVKEKTTQKYLTQKSFHGTDTNKDTLWNQVATHVIQEIFIRIRDVFVGDGIGGTKYHTGKTTILIFFITQLIFFRQGQTLG